MQGTFRKAYAGWPLLITRRGSDHFVYYGVRHERLGVSSWPPSSPSPRKFVWHRLALFEGGLHSRRQLGRAPRAGIEEYRSRRLARCWTGSFFPLCFFLLLGVGRGGGACLDLLVSSFRPITGSERKRRKNGRTRLRSVPPIPYCEIHRLVFPMNRLTSY